MLLEDRGHPLHTRSLTVEVRQEGDGRWHARGDVIDLRKCGFVPMMSELQPAGIIHQMNIDLALDAASLEILSLDTHQPHVAIDASAASEGESCRTPATRLEALVGTRLDAAFPRALSARFGGPRGCSHLLTLFQLMASTLPAVRAHEDGLGSAPREGGERIAWRSVFIDGSDDTGEDGQEAVGLAVQLADFFTRPRHEAPRGLDRLSRAREVRVQAQVERAGMQLRAPRAATRERGLADLASAAWHDRSDAVAFLTGAPIHGGIARRLFEAFPAQPDETLLDALLQLAPGYLQVLAALTERWLPDAPGDRGEARLGQQGPAIATLGGMPNSCFMWRDDGPLAATRTKVSG